MTKQIDEISKGRLGAYIEKASKSVDKLVDDGFKNNSKKRSLDDIKNHSRKINNKRTGIWQAKNKLHKEEVEDVQELSKRTLANYIGAASADKSHHAHKIGGINAKAAGEGTTARDREERDYHNDQHKKRSGGINRAANKLAKEEVEMNNFSIIESILSDKPLDAKKAFDEIMSEKVNEAVAAYQEVFIESEFGGPEDEIEEVDIDSLTSEEIEELLSSLSDDELEELETELGAVWENEDGLEESELHEISKQRLGAYMSKSLDNINDARSKRNKASSAEMADGHRKTVAKRTAGHGLATAKNLGVAKVLAKEEVEQIDEISKQRLHSYVNKASDNKTHHTIKGGTATDSNKQTQHYNKAGKRWVGINNALHKMRGTTKVKATD